MMSQDLAAKQIDLTLENRLEACVLEPELETPDT
jgi:hypothetical protein